MGQAHRIAVIGAGMAGLSCARRLADGGAEVVVFDKGRGLGGRIATRRGPAGGFDHGAVRLAAAPDPATPEAQAYADYLTAAAGQGALVWWPAGQAFVGVPGMSAAVRPLAQGLTVHTGIEVSGLSRTPGGWMLQGTSGANFDQVVLAIPQPQARALLSPWPALADQIAAARMRAVWTAMARFDRPLPVTGDILTWPDGAVAMAVRNSAKPGRADAEGGEAWVIHAGADWTAAHLEQDKPAAAALLLAAFLAEAGLDPVPPVTLEGHRWRYGLTAQPLGQACLRDADLGLSVCGDWCLGDSAADALASGRAVAAMILGQ